jgi:hypothetical protein
VIRSPLESRLADAAEVAKDVAEERRQPRVVAQEARIGELAPVKRRGGAEFVEVLEDKRRMDPVVIVIGAVAERPTKPRSLP